MVAMLLLIFIFLQNIVIHSSTPIKIPPLCSVYTKKSILEHKKKYTPLFIGSRKRWATCTGAVWFHNDYLAVINLHGAKLNTYKFNPEKNCFDMLQEINNLGDGELVHPENITISPDGLFLVICFAKPCPGIKMYNIDPETHLINPKPIFGLETTHLIHSIRFTHDDCYFATAGFNNDEATCIYKVLKKNHTINLILASKATNIYKNLVAKGIIFTKNSNFVILLYSSSAHGGKKTSFSGVISVHKFNPDMGTIGEQVCHLDGNFCYEDMALADHDHTLIFSDQSHDALVIYPFDPVTGQINKHCSIIQGQDTQLSFPHGLGLRQDDKYLVVTNYGDDTFNLYQLGKN